MLIRSLAAVLLLVSAAPAHADPWQRACSSFYRQAGMTPPPRPAPLRLDAVVEHLVRGDALGHSGTALIDAGGDTVLARGNGVADEAGRTPVSTGTVIDIGSVSKQFTAAAIMLLAEQGRLRTGDPVARFLPDVPIGKRSITVHHLLIHTSGLPAEVAEAREAWSRADAVRAVLAAPLAVEPGARHAYSNAGYLLLAAIVEAASGRQYEEVLTDLFRRAGLDDTGWQIARRPGFAAARGENLAGSVPTPDPAIWAGDGPNWGRRGPGALLSTPEDLRRWARALMGGKVLSSASVEQMISPHVREPGEQPSFYGYGWAVSAGPDGACRIWHDGSNSRHFNVLSIFPERDLVTHVSSTAARSPVGAAVLRDFHPVLLAGAPSALPERRPLGAADAARLQGAWTDADGNTIRFVERGGRLHLRATAPAVARLFTGFEPLPAGDAARVARARPELPAILDGIASGRIEPLFAVLRADQPPQEEARYWREQVARWTADHGAYRASEIVATLRRGDRVLSYALLHFDRRSIPVTISYDESGRIFIGTNIEARPDIDILPLEYAVSRDRQGSLRVDNPAFESSVRLLPSADGRTLRLLCPRGEEILRRPMVSA